MDKAWENTLSELSIHLSYMLPQSELDKFEVTLDTDGVNKIAKAIMDNKNEVEFWINVEEDRNGYTKVSKYDFIEKFVEGQDPTIKPSKKKSYNESDDELEPSNSKGGSLF